MPSTEVMISEPPMSPPIHEPAALMTAPTSAPSAAAVTRETTSAMSEEADASALLRRTLLQASLFATKSTLTVRQPARAKAPTRAPPIAPAPPTTQTARAADIFVLCDEEVKIWVFGIMHTLLCCAHFKTLCREAVVPI
jgi:hypothetical protein